MLYDPVGAATPPPTPSPAGASRPSEPPTPPEPSPSSSPRNAFRLAVCSSIAALAAANSIINSSSSTPPAAAGSCRVHIERRKSHELAHMGATHGCTAVSKTNTHTSLLLQLYLSGRLVARVFPTDCYLPSFGKHTCSSDTRLARGEMQHTTHVRRGLLRITACL